jgi:hypothetical protein
VKLDCLARDTRPYTFTEPERFVDLPLDNRTLSRGAPAFTRLALVLACVGFTIPISAAVLSGSFIPISSATNVNLTTAGNVDWVHWGLAFSTNVNRKTAVTPRLNTATIVGTNSLLLLSTNLQRVSWSDGTPTLAVTNSASGVFVQGLTNGFEIVAAAGQQRRRLQIHAGAYAASGLIQATLSDAAAPGYYDESLTSPWTATNTAAVLTNGVFIIDFAAASDGQTLNVRFTAQTVYDTNSGFVSLQAATLASNALPTVLLTSPTNTQKFFHSASVTLTAEASDPDGSIAKVEFYQGTNVLGESLSPPYTMVWENVAPSNYTLVALAYDQEGATNVSAPVLITVQNNFAPTVTITNPLDFTSFTLPTNVLINATASDLDGSISNVAFYAGSTKLGEVTNSPYQFVWTNPPAGEHLLTAKATDNNGATTTSSSVDIFVTQPGGYLAVSATTASEPVDLDAAGPADWAHWGLLTEASFNHKRGVVSQISNFSVIGNDPHYAYADNPITYSWADGTPILAATNTPTGVYVIGRRNGFALQAPAGVTTNTLKLYVGAFAARGRLLAYLNDFSAPAISDFSVDNPGNGPGTLYTIRYASASAAKLLRLRFIGDTMYNNSVGNVTLQAAALDTGNFPPSAFITNPANGFTLQWPGPVTIHAQAGDSDGTVTNLEFFRDGVKLGQTPTPPYSMVWTNPTIGIHSLVVRATDNRGLSFSSRAAEVFLTPGGGSLIVTSAFPSAQVDLPAEGFVDWAHWGLARANSFDHKSEATVRISNANRILAGGQINRYDDNYSGYSWTNGTPTPEALGTKTGIYLNGVSNGFELNAPADLSRRRLRVYVGLYGARARFEAFLTDSSAKPFVDTSVYNVYGNQYRVYTIDYASAIPGQQLVVRHTVNELFDEAYGNVTLQSATLADLPPPHLLNATWDGQAFSFGFLTLDNRSYSIQYADSIPSTNWQPLQNFAGTGLPFWYTNSLPPSPQRFYRVVEY